MGGDQREALTEALGRGLMALDAHDWNARNDDEAWESLRLDYRHRAERFLVPAVEGVLGGGS